MNKFLKYVGSLFVLILLAVFFSGCDGMLRKEESFESSFHITNNTDYSLLDVDSRNGSIEVIPWNENFFKIEGKKFIQGSGNLDELIEKVQIREKEIGSVIRIYIDFPESNNFLKNTSYGANLTISVPTDIFSSLEKIDLDSSNGPVYLSSFTGSIVADTSNSSMKFEGCTGDLKAKSTNGSISLNNVKGQIDVTTSNASIQLNDCFLTGSSNHFQTTNGSIDGDFTPPLSGNTTFSTSNSWVTLRVPSISNINFSARTSNGSISTENLLVKLTQDSKNSKNGMVNEGGAKIDIKSSNGNVKIIGE
ncbi:MAG TPA: hypothetical protein PK466_03945 [Thermotogota bacterium]|nr:hypothetical protein [Thermotogota bacterium]HPJ88376.1 hypothetical protein [Thermotogota bacterium]HPR95456.1 hypothetical protein [Thermotogota bacterium]